MPGARNVQKQFILCDVVVRKRRFKSTCKKSDISQTSVSVRLTFAIMHEFCTNVAPGNARGHGMHKKNWFREISLSGNNVRNTHVKSDTSQTNPVVRLTSRSFIDLAHVSLLTE